MKVQAANGLIFDLPEAVATGLVASKGNGIVAHDEPVIQPPTLEKRRPGRPRKPKVD